MYSRADLRCFPHWSVETHPPACALNVWHGWDDAVDVIALPAQQRGGGRGIPDDPLFMGLHDLVVVDDAQTLFGLEDSWDSVFLHVQSNMY